MALRALRRMYRADQGLFAFRLRRNSEGDQLEGHSRRYTATALIGLAEETEDVAQEILAGCSRQDVCGRLLERMDKADDLGEVALTLWAARALNHPDASRATDRLRLMAPGESACPTVELAWSLSALVAEGGTSGADEDLAHKIARRLLSSFWEESALFPHCLAGARRSRLRGHVACFADLVYPIQALSFYHLATGSDDALETARRCAKRMCSLQGSEGQWWWHYDVRTGRIVERYPVYAVHQDSMAPMALFALRNACGVDVGEAVERGVNWLCHPPEIGGTLIDRQADVIWRKVARQEPGKLVRGLQASASCLHPVLRVPGTDLLFRARSVDYESRPYHMGWILHAWSARYGSAPRGERKRQFDHG